MRLFCALAAVAACGGQGKTGGDRGRGIDCQATAQTRVGDVIVATNEARANPRAATFSGSPSSFEEPIEVCGVGGQLAVLTTLRCDDGSRPFADRGAAHRSRVGSADGGGRCGKAIDLYKVACPEKTYDVFLDLYVCTRAEIAGIASTLARFIDDGFEIKAPPGWEFRRASWGALGRYRDGSARMAVVAGLGDGGFDLEAATARARQAIGGPAVADVAAGDRRVLLAAPAGSPLVDQLRGQLAEVARGFRTHDHRYRDYADLIIGDATSLDIVADEREGAVFFYPKGWKLLVKSAASYIARTDEAGGLSFSHSRYPRGELPAELTTRELARALLARFVNSDPVVVVYSGAGDRGDSHRVVLVRGSSWVSIVVARTASQWLISAMTGRRQSFIELSAILLNETLSAATAGALEAN